MLAENLENWAQRERQAGEKLDIEKGEQLAFEVSSRAQRGP